MKITGCDLILHVACPWLGSFLSLEKDFLGTLGFYPSGYKWNESYKWHIKQEKKLALTSKQDIISRWSD